LNKNSLLWLDATEQKTKKFAKHCLKKPKANDGENNVHKSM